jgi:hypothetical protein
MARAGQRGRRAGDGKTIFHQNQIVSLKQTKHTKHLPKPYAHTRTSKLLNIYHKYQNIPQQLLKYQTNTKQILNTLKYTTTINGDPSLSAGFNKIY